MFSPSVFLFPHLLFIETVLTFFYQSEDVCVSFSCSADMAPFIINSFDVLILFRFILSLRFIIRHPTNHHHDHTEPADHYFINKLGDHDYIPPPPPYVHPLYHENLPLSKTRNTGRYYIDPITFKVYQ